MDANGARFWMWSGPNDLVPSEMPARIRHDAERGAWTLVSSAEPPAFAESESLATTLLEQPRAALDVFGSQARVERSETASRVLVSYEGLAEREIWTSAEPVTDVAIGADGVISVIADGAIWLRHAGTLGDSREGWQRLDEALLQGDTAPSELNAALVAPRPNGGAFVLDREHGFLAVWSGVPLRNRPDRLEAPGTFRPEPEAPKTLDLRIVHREGFGGDRGVALACAPNGRVAVLGWRDANGSDLGYARLHIFEADGTPAQAEPMVLLGLRRPFSITWLNDERIAVLATIAAAEGGSDRVVPEALVYAWDGERAALPAGERYPLRRHDGRAFLHAPLDRPRYGSSTGPRPLAALSLPRRAITGSARARSIDSGEAGTCWHRLYVEGVFPEGCAIRVLLAASDDPEPPEDSGQFYPHDFGAVPGSEAPVPRAAWEPHASEIPSQRGLLGCAPEFQRAGLWSVLIQRANCRTRRLVGRYLHAHFVFFGTGQFSPELAAARAYSPRFSYVRRYLPELYHEDPLLEGDATPGPATSADFLERFVASFEGVLTPIEDRVADAWQLINPRTTPADALEWLGTWVGMVLDPALPDTARRKLLYFAPQLACERGTRCGLSRALEIVSQGGISRGEVVVIEDFRLRRTWATILGADLADETDPLLGGLTINTNSIVGDTLFLGDEHQREFLALFSERALIGDDEVADREAVEAFFEQSALRATVLVFDGVDDATYGCIRRVVEREQPAHVQVQVKRASRNFIVAVSALVGVDTRLGVEPPPSSVRLGSTRIGSGDRLQRRAAMHPDLEGDAG